MISGMMRPTESVVIANMANIRYVSVLSTAMFGCRIMKQPQTASISDQHRGEHAPQRYATRYRVRDRRWAANETHLRMPDVCCASESNPELNGRLGVPVPREF